MYAVPGFDDEGIDASPEVVEKENSETSDECIPTEEPVKGITTDSQTTEYSDLY